MPPEQAPRGEACRAFGRHLLDGRDALGALRRAASLRSEDRSRALQQRVDRELSRASPRRRAPRGPPMRLVWRSLRSIEPVVKKALALEAKDRFATAEDDAGCAQRRRPVQSSRSYRGGASRPGGGRRLHGRTREDPRRQRGELALAASPGGIATGGGVEPSRPDPLVRSAHAHQRQRPTTLDVERASPRRGPAFARVPATSVSPSRRRERVAPWRWSSSSRWSTLAGVVVVLAVRICGHSSELASTKETSAVAPAATGPLPPRTGTAQPHDQSPPALPAAPSSATGHRLGAGRLGGTVVIGAATRCCTRCCAPRRRAITPVPFARVRSGGFTRPSARLGALSASRSRARAVRRPAPAAATPNCDPPFYYEGTKKVFKPGCL